MTISESQKKYLRGLGHKLKAVILIGEAGVSDTLFKEFDSTIDHHELVKVRVRAADRENRDRMLEDLCQRGSALLISRVGNTALLYRRNDNNPRIQLPGSR